MTIKQVFEEWAKQPISKKLAGIYRPAFTSVFLKTYGDTDIKEVDSDFIVKVLAESDQPTKSKVRASSTMVTLKLYAGNCHYCEHMELDFEDISKSAHGNLKPEPEPEATPQQQQANPKPKATPKAAPKPHKAKPKKVKATSKRKINDPKAVVQLDPVTYQPIKTFANAAVAGKAVGSTNVLRAVKGHTISAGYFWAYEAGVKDFKPCNGTLKRRAIKANHMVPPGVTDAAIENVIEELDAASDRLREEQEEREAERKAKAEILAEYTNDEILSEIRRRDWKGNVIIPINFDL